MEQAILMWQSIIGMSFMVRKIAISHLKMPEWQAALEENNIRATRNLVDAVYAASDEISVPTAQKAFRGQGIDQLQWKKVFRALKLDWERFFNAHEWDKIDAKVAWDRLLAVAEDANDRFGLVLAPSFQESSIRDALPQKTRKYETVFSKGEYVLVEFPADLHGFLILLEQNTAGGFDLVAPSCLMQNNRLEGKLQRLPQYPPASVPSIPLRSLGASSLWAGVFDDLPQWDWLAGAEKDFLSLDVEQLDEILEFAKSQNRATIWRSSYTVTAT